MAGSKRGPQKKAPDLKVVSGQKTKAAAAKETAAAERRRPAAGTVKMPTGMSPAAQAVWKRLAPDLIKRKVLRPAFVDGFEQFCEAVAIAREARRLTARQGLIVSGEKHDAVKHPAQQIWRDANAVMSTWSTRFGLTAADCDNLAEEEAPDDGQGVEEFFTA